MPQRLEAWQRLARDLDKTLLADMTRHVPFANTIDIAHDILQGKVRGRVVVDVA